MGVREFVDDFPSFFLSVPLCGYSGGLRDPFATTKDTEGTEGEGRSWGDGINGCLRNPRKCCGMVGVCEILCVTG